MYPLQMLAKCPLAICPLTICPLTKCPLAKRPLAICPGFAHLHKIDLSHNYECCTCITQFEVLLLNATTSCTYTSTNLSEPIDLHISIEQEVEEDLNIHTYTAKRTIFLLTAYLVKYYNT